MGAMHADDELMVRHRLIDKAPPGVVHRDQAGLRAVERKMRIGAAPASQPPGFRHRRPECRLRVIVLDSRTGRARGRHALAARARECDSVLERRADIFVEFLDAAAEPAGRKHDGAPCRHVARLAIDRKGGASHAATGTGQFAKRCIEPNRHIALAQAVEQPRCERVAHQERGSRAGGPGGRWHAARAARADGGSSQPIQTGATAARCHRARSSCRQAP